MKRVAILGGGALGRTLCHHAQSAGWSIAGFYDDTLPEGEVLGHPVLGGVEAASSGGAWDALVMGIGYRHLHRRQELFERLEGQGVAFASLVHPSCYVDRSATVGAGASLFPGCVLDAGVVLGRNTVLNAGCVIAHDSVVGDHCFFGPGVHLAGFVEVRERCFLGIATSVIDHVVVGADTQTGGGSVVIRDIAGGGLWVGSPVRFVRPHAERL